MTLLYSNSYLLFIDTSITSINEAALDDEESPLLVFNQGNKSSHKHESNKMAKLTKEAKINDFLKRMNVEMIVPGEVNYIKLMYTKNKDCLTPTLKLGKNSLLMKRKLKLMK